MDGRREVKSEPWSQATITTARCIRPFCYVASPYTRFLGGHEEAYRQVCQAAAWLVKQKIRVYCPVSHTHGLTYFGGLDPFDYAIWNPLNEPFMVLSGAMILVKMAGYEASDGIRQENEYFCAAHKPVFMLDWPHPENANQ